MILNNRPLGVSCGNAVWHAPQASPVCRAKLGNALVSRGANDMISITESATKRAQKVNTPFARDLDARLTMPLSPPTRTISAPWHDRIASCSHLVIQTNQV